MNKKIAIIGAGGHGKVVGEIALLNNYKKIDFFDDKFENIKYFPFNIVNNLEYLSNHINDYNAYFVAIGDNELRCKKIEWLKKYETNIVNLIHPNSILSKFITIGVGTCVMANVAINSGTSIGNGIVINTSASIDHDCVIEDYAHISPNCSLSGDVKIGRFTHVGTGSSIHPGISIGKHVKTSIGSRIFKNVLDNVIYKE